MCGILGQIGNRPINREVLFKQLQLISHRGPDHMGEFVSQDQKIYLGHRRLSILDLSNSGNQPMISPSKRYVLVFNGEIYNFKDLQMQIMSKNKLHIFRGTSDTEILLASFELFGVNKTLKSIRGMFAIALYDQLERKIFLARDRAGEKPLYYSVNNNCLFFASELKCFSHFTDLKINKKALNLFIAQGNIPSPFSIFSNVFKLEPGHIIEFRSGDLIKKKFWEIEPIENIASNSFQENFKIFEKTFLSAVNEQMASDVPLGAFLSGGLDSSSVVAAMQEQSIAKVKTHTISYDEFGYDESDAARLIATHLGTDHNEYHFTSKDALELIPDLPTIFCEPFSDSSQIPTFFISKMTRSNVKVSLSGDGGDELFGGYNRYIFFKRFHAALKFTPFFLRKNIANILKKSVSNSGFKPLMLKIFSSTYNIRGPLEKLEKIALTMSNSSFEDMYFSLLQQFQYNYWPLKNSFSIDPKKIYKSFLSQEIDSFLDMRELDFINYLPNDILTKLDRSSMAVSLESRVPFLDSRLINFAFSLSSNHLIYGNNGKLLLREFLSTRVPAEILSLPKSGFGVPIEHWFRSELKGFSEDILFNENIFNEIFDIPVIREIWDNHQQEKNLNHHKLWTILMLKLWLKNNSKLISF